MKLMARPVLRDSLSAACGAHGFWANCRF